MSQNYSFRSWGKVGMGARTTPKQGSDYEMLRKPPLYPPLRRAPQKGGGTIQQIIQSTTFATPSLAANGSIPTKFFFQPIRPSRLKPLLHDNHRRLGERPLFLASKTYLT